VRVDQLPPYGDRVVLGRQQHLGYVDSRLALPFLKTRLRGMFGVQFLEEDRLVERLASVGGGVVGVARRKSATLAMGRVDPRREPPVGRYCCCVMA
jgi:hypothetical protein